MKQYKSEIFGDIVSPENFIELTELVTQNINNKYGNVWLWRGQGDIQWPLHSGAYRRNEKENKNVREKDIVFYEKHLLNQARHRGYGCIEGITISDVELLARLQHHGAATRLVDFSKNFLIALWFCIDLYNFRDKTGLLLGIHTSYIGGSSEGELDYERSDYSKFIEDLSNTNHPMFLESPVVSKRIAAQHGVFLYSDVCHDIKGSIKIPKEKEGSIFIAIDPKIKSEAREILIQSYDIRNETLFPDLDGFSYSNNTLASVYEMYRW